ncbi:MAG: site-specific integrase [Cyclobacteriaceae bacterium]|nr:site-specific integrase [Cyclobacteriaceae bacterium]
MRAQTTFGISFFIKKHKASKGKAPIYARITVNGKSTDISIKRSIEVENWSSGKSQVIGNRFESSQINDYLAAVQTQLYDCKTQLERERKFVTAKAIKSRYTGEDQQSITLLHLVNYHNTEMKSELTEGTLKNYRSTERYLKKFLKDKLKTTDIYLQELNYNFIKSFERYIRNNPLQENSPCNQNGIMKHMERLSKMVTMAVKEEWLEKDPFIKYKLKFEKTERGYLDEDELFRIETTPMPTKGLELTRDVFVFACYTGLAYIETYNLSYQDISKGIDGENWITGQRQKSKEFFGIPILPKAQEILDKYKNDPRAINKNKCLYVYANQKINENLKKIAAICGITKHLTFYLARHTFATTITLANDIPIETVSEMLGHTKLTTTQIYAKVIRKKVSRDMAKLRMKLSANEAKKEASNDS